MTRWQRICAAVAAAFAVVAGVLAFRRHKPASVSAAKHIAAVADVGRAVVDAQADAALSRVPKPTADPLAALARARDQRQRGERKGERK